MGSIMMHLCISEKIREKYNFSNQFLIGSVLPDIYKKTTMDRSRSHYLTQLRESDGSTITVPNLDNFIQNNIHSLQDEVTLGYFAHLVEDYIWFRYFSSKLVRRTRLGDSNEEVVTYAHEGYRHMHLFLEFKEDIYNDYAIWDKRISSSAQFDIEAIKTSLKQYLKNSIYNNTIDSELIIHEPQKSQDLLFLTDELVQRYIKTALEAFDIEYKKLQNVMQEINKKA